MNVLDLFSGIGGFSLGLESTGFFKTIAFVEKDKFCQKVLQKNFPNIPIEDDVRNVKGEKYRADVITGGFPCQPFSVAGKRRGTDDDRFLWDETIRIVSETKPKWFIGENVEGIINIQDGMVFRQIHDDLESEGFETQSLIIPASSTGAFHQRKRVWIIGCNEKNISNTNNIRSVRVQEPEEEIIGGSKATSNSSSSYDVSNTFGKLSDGCSSTTRNSNSKFSRVECNESWNWNEVRSKAERCSKQVREDVSNSNSKRSQGFGLQSDNLQEGNKTTISSDNSSKEQQTWWQTQSNLCGVPNGVSYELDKDRANRIKSLGNSIVPQIAREIGLGIMEAEIG